MRTVGVIILIGCLVCPAYAGTDNENCMNLVNTAAKIFKTQGKDTALKYVNSLMGPLRNGAVYVFAVDFKGAMLGHPVQEDLRGQDAWELKDTKGKFIVQEFIKIAKEQGQGWTEYWWLRASETSPTLKRTFIKRVPDEDILLGAGYYIK